VTVNGASVSNVNFTAQSVATSALAIDTVASQDLQSKSSTVTIPAFTTNSKAELLVAFVAANYLSGANTNVTGITGGSLTWVLVKRTNTQSGTAEIWRAFSPNPLSNVSITASLSQSVIASMTVVSFSGADSSGTNGSGAIGAAISASGSSGAPSATLTTTRNNSWVFGVGNDYDNARAHIGVGADNASSSIDFFW
jgi:hypothetical protein